MKCITPNNDFQPGNIPQEHSEYDELLRPTSDLDEYAVKGDIEKISDIISKREFNLFDLMKACQIASNHNNIECCKLLLNQTLALSVVEHEDNDIKIIIENVVYLGTIDAFDDIFDADEYDHKNALMYAIKSDNEKALNLLLDYGANINLSNKFGETPLMIACRNDSYKMAKILIEKGADVNAYNINNETPLMLSILSSSPDITRLLLDTKVDINAQNKDGLTALMLSSKFGYYSIRLLIEKGTDINIRDKNGMTALMLAIEEKQTDSIQQILSYNSNLDLKNNLGKAAWQLINIERLLRFDAESDTDEPTDKEYETYKYDKLIIQKSLFFAVKKRDLETVKLILSQTGYVNICDNEQKTILMLAAESGNVAITEFLLANGADWKIEAYGKNALMFAAKKHNKILVDLLIHKTGYQNDSYYSQKTAIKVAGWNEHNSFALKIIQLGMMHAASAGNLKTMNLLIENGAFWDDCNEEGTTPLMMASAANHVEVIDLLLERQNPANIDRTNIHGKTALMMAVINKRHLAIKRLLDKGAKAFISDNDGNTALIYAARNGDINTIKLLHAYNSNWNAYEQNNTGHTVFMYAVLSEHEETINYLLEQETNIYAENCLGKDSFVIAAEKNKIKAIKLIAHKFKESFEHAFEAAYKKQNIEILKFLISELDNEDEVSSLLEELIPISVINGYELNLEWLSSEPLLAQYPKLRDQLDFDNNEFLLLAAMKGKIHTVAKLLKKPIEIDTENIDKKTPLLLAAENGHTAIVRFLLAKGSDINKVDNKGNNALLLATKNGHLSTFRYLVKKVGDKNTQNNDGKNITTLANENGHTEILANILDENITIDSYQELLTVATKNNKENNIELILSKISDKDFFGKLSEAALISASQYRRKEIVSYLLKRVISIEAKTPFGWTSLMVAVSKNEYSIVYLLLSEGANIHAANMQSEDSLFIASMYGNNRIIELLLRYGANIDCIDQFGKTPLMIAAMRGHYETVELLLQHGVDINATDNDNRTALILAIENNNFSILKLLLDYDACIDSCSTLSITPLMKAIQNENNEIAELLIVSNTNLNKLNHEGLSALSIAVRKNNLRITELLLEHGADLPEARQDLISLLQTAPWWTENHLAVITDNLPNNVNMETLGWASTLSFAAMCGNLELFKLLIETGCTDDINSALQAAVLAHRNNIVEYILEHGGNPTAENNKGQKILHFACNNGNIEAVKIISNWIFTQQSLLPDIEEIHSSEENLNTLRETNEG